MKLHSRWVSIIFAMATFVAGGVCFFKDEIPTACYFMGLAIWFKMDAKWRNDP